MRKERESQAIQALVARLQVIAGRISVVSGEHLASLSDDVQLVIAAAAATPLTEHVLRKFITELILRLELVAPNLRTAEEMLREILRVASVPIPALANELTRTLTNVRARVEGTHPMPHTADPRVRAALTYLHANHARSSLSRDEVAKAVRLSKWHLDRLLRRDTSCSFLTHLHVARLTAATRLLMDPTRAVKEISNSLGYSSVTMFDRRFKREFSMTPMEWRRKHIR